MIEASVDVKLNIVEVFVDVTFSIEASIYVKPSIDGSGV